MCESSRLWSLYLCMNSVNFPWSEINSMLYKSTSPRIYFPNTENVQRKRKQYVPSDNLSLLLNTVFHSISQWISMPWDSWTSEQTKNSPFHPNITVITKSCCHSSWPWWVKNLSDNNLPFFASHVCLCIAFLFNNQIKDYGWTFVCKVIKIYSLDRVSETNNLVFRAIS